MWRQGELTLKAPGGLSQLAGPELLGEDQTKGLRCWEGRKSTDLQSQGPVWLCKARAGCSQEPFRRAPGYGINTVQLPVPPTR